MIGRNLVSPDPLLFAGERIDIGCLLVEQTFPSIGPAVFRARRMGEQIDVGSRLLELIGQQIQFQSFDNIAVLLQKFLHLCNRKQFEEVVHSVLNFLSSKHSQNPFKVIS